MTETRPLRLGVIGAGYHAVHDHLPALALYRRSHPDRVAVVAACDPRAAAAAAVAAAHDGCRPFDDVEALLAAACCDAVMALTPSHLNAGIAIRLLDAGVPVLMEKPIGTDLVEGEAVCAAARRTGTPVMVGLNRRFDPYLAAAGRAIAGRPVLRATAMVVRHARTRAGFVADVGAHAVDYLTHVLGPLTLRERHPWAGTGEGVHAALATAAGAPVAVDLLPTGGMHLERYEFVGQDWRVVAEAAGSCRRWEAGALVDERVRAADEPRVLANGTVAETAAFIDGLRDGTRLHPAPREALVAFRTVQDILERSR